MSAPIPTVETVVDRFERRVLPELAPLEQAVRAARWAERAERCREIALAVGLLCGAVLLAHLVFDGTLALSGLVILVGLAATPVSLEDSPALAAAKRALKTRILAGLGESYGLRYRGLPAAVRPAQSELLGACRRLRVVPEHFHAWNLDELHSTDDSGDLCFGHFTLLSSTPDNRPDPYGVRLFRGLGLRVRVPNPSGRALRFRSEGGPLGWMRGSVLARLSRRLRRDPSQTGWRRLGTGYPPFDRALTVYGRGFAGPEAQLPRPLMEQILLMRRHFGRDLRLAVVRDEAVLALPTRRDLFEPLGARPARTEKADIALVAHRIGTALRLAERVRRIGAQAVAARSTTRPT